MDRDYDWDLESPVDDPLSVDRNIGPKYKEELKDLYNLFQAHPTVDSEFNHSRDSERINEWEQMVDLATYQFETVTDTAEVSQEQAEKMFDTGEVLVYNLLDDFSDFHADDYSHFTSERDAESIDDLRDAYREAYDTLDDLDDNEFFDKIGFEDSLDEGGLGGDVGGGDVGGGDIGGGDI